MTLREELEALEHYNGIDGVYIRRDEALAILSKAEGPLVCGACGSTVARGDYERINVDETPAQEPCPYYCEPSHVKGETCTCPCHAMTMDEREGVTLDDLRKMPEPIPAPPEAPRRWRCGLGHECDEGWVRCPKCSLPVREVVEDTGSGGET